VIDGAGFILALNDSIEATPRERANVVLTVRDVLLRTDEDRRDRERRRQRRFLLCGRRSGALSFAGAVHVDAEP
jgi:hypothetical protein